MLEKVVNLAEIGGDLRWRLEDVGFREVVLLVVVGALVVAAGGLTVAAVLMVVGAVVPVVDVELVV